MVEGLASVKEKAVSWPRPLQNEIENECSVSFSQCLCCKSATSLCIDQFSLANCLRIVLFPILQSNYSWYCNLSHLTVDLGFCLATVHLFIDLVQTGSSAEATVSEALLCKDIAGLDLRLAYMFCSDKRARSHRTSRPSNRSSVV